MRIRNSASNIGTVLLAALIFVLSTGIHDWYGHIAISYFLQPSDRECFAPQSNLNPPAQDHCNACYFNRLLRHCLFPVSLRPSIAEFFRARPQFHRELIAFLNPTPEFNRGPPPTAFLA
jgi:hypothetical protein